MRNRLAVLTVALAIMVTLTGCGGAPEAAPTPTVELVAVADVAGLDAKEASGALEDAGFRTQYDAGDETVLMASNWTVDSTTPAAGESAEAGSVVVLHVSKPEVESTPEVATATSAGLTGTPAQAACDQRIDAEFPFGSDPHWIMGVIANEIVNDQWFFKVEVTVTNAYDAEQEMTVECTVGGTDTAPELISFAAY